MKILILSLLLSSCAKLTYITEQGIGQVSLEYDDTDIEDFLTSKKYDQKQKDKVLVVQKAKKYFYEYFDLEEVPIYDEVKLLDQEAVTYLVIHSPKDEIKSIKTNFPIVGSFPYLGFFKKESALEYKLGLEDKGYSTFMRPVYAYSTLNHPLWPFDDNILSSFFYFSDEDLTELIFHELVHTILFVKDDLTSNENLANYIAREMVKDFYGIEYYKKLHQQELRSKEFSRIVTKKANLLNQKYKKSSNPNKTLSDFLKDDFIPSIETFCEKFEIRNCHWTKQEWNNARFSAFNTYEIKQNKIDTLYKRYNSLKSFVLDLKEKAKDYRGKNFIDDLIKD